MESRLIWAPVLAALTMTACTFRGGIERSAVDYNEAADRVQKELLLKNIARALVGEGPTYTEIAEMRGSFTLQAQASATIPFGGAADPKFDIKPSALFQTNPSVKITPLATSEFQRGISSSVKGDTLLNLWESGWPEEVLLHVLVEKVVFTADVEKFEDACPIGTNTWELSASGKRAECVFLNDPDDPVDFWNYRELLRIAQFIPFEANVPGEPVGPEVSRDELDMLGLVAKAHDGDLIVKRIRRNADGEIVDDESTAEGLTEFFRLETPSRKTVSFSSDAGRDAAREKEIKKREKRQKEPDGGAVPESEELGGLTEEPSGVVAPAESLKESEFPKGLFQVSPAPPPAAEDEPERNGKEKDVFAVKPTQTIHLRSPEGMIVYLGELSRPDKNGEYPKGKISYQEIYKDDTEGIACSSYKGVLPEEAEILPEKKGEILSEDESKRVRRECLDTLFDVRSGPGEADVAVEHRGERYFIPAGGKERSGKTLLVLSLVRQLFNANTSRDDLPSTQTVVTTGGGVL